MVFLSDSHGCDRFQKAPSGLFQADWTNRCELLLSRAVVLDRSACRADWKVPQLGMAKSRVCFVRFAWNTLKIRTDLDLSARFDRIAPQKLCPS